MGRNDIAFLSATELGSAIQSKQVSPVEAVEAYLERIERIDPKINSYITVCADQALADARQAEAEGSSGETTEAPSTAFLWASRTRFTPKASAPPTLPRFGPTS